MPNSVPRKVITTRKEALYRGDKEPCTGVVCKKLYELVHFYGRTMSTKYLTMYLHVCTDNKSID